MKRFAAPIVTVYDRYHYACCERILGPYIQERMIALEEQIRNPSPDYKEPNTCLQWTINEASKSWHRSEWTPANIAKRVIVFIIVTFQVTAIAVTNTLFDIAASPDGQVSLEKLREEAAATADSLEGGWNLDPAGPTKDDQN